MCHLLLISQIAWLLSAFTKRTSVTFGLLMECLTEARCSGQVTRGQNIIFNLKPCLELPMVLCFWQWLEHT